MTRHNERKRQVLDYINRYPDSTSADLASALDLEIHNARTLLKKYHRQGLLRRRKVDRWGTRSYEITEKALARLEWLRGNLEGKEEVFIRREFPTPNRPVRNPPVERINKRDQAVERLRKIADLLSQLNSSE